MPQWTYAKKPNWYPEAKVEATDAGWAHVDTGELLVAIGGLTDLNTDAAVAPTFTLTLPADNTYGATDVLTFQIDSDEDVRVVGNPTLLITFHDGIGGTRLATFDADNSLADSLLFKYTVTAADVLMPVTDVAIQAGGTGYAVDDVLTVVGGTGTAATLLVTSVAAGVVDGVSVLTPGAYSVDPVNPVSVTGGTGNDDATFNLTIWDGQITDVADNISYVYDVVGTEEQIEKADASYTVGDLTGIIIG